MDIQGPCRYLLLVRHPDSKQIASWHMLNKAKLNKLIFFIMAISFDVDVIRRFSVQPALVDIFIQLVRFPLILGA